MESILPALNHWFGQKQAYLSCFARNDVRVEGWFKGEMLLLLEELQTKGTVAGFEREPQVSALGKRKQVDFAVRLNATKHWLELKALCISRSLGTPRNLAFYFRDDSVGLLKDFQKLGQLSVPNKWLIAFVYPSPKEEERKRVSLLPSEFSSWRCLTNPCDYPSWLFLSLWHYTD